MLGAYHPGLTDCRGLLRRDAGDLACLRRRDGDLARYLLRLVVVQPVARGDQELCQRRVRSGVQGEVRHAHSLAIGVPRLL